MPCGQKTKKENRNDIGINSIKTFKMVHIKKNLKRKNKSHINDHILRLSCGSLHAFLPALLRLLSASFRWFSVAKKAACLPSHFSCVRLCNLMDYIPSGSSVCGMFQASILEWVAMPSSRESSQPRDQTQVS